LQRIRIKYKKGAELRFIGHLDLVRLWERAIRRTELPIAYTEGFNVRQRLSFGPPLSLGLTSECEYIDLHFERWTSPETAAKELCRALPKGIDISEVKGLFSAIPSIADAVKSAVYQAEADDAEAALEEIKTILASKEIIVQRKDKKKDIRPMIKELAVKDGKVSIMVECSNSGSLKAGEIRGLFKRTALKDLKRVLLY